ncbi:MAG: hypothetical protein MZV70_56085 [Desulfobacterales bacterium]|nr:hypothetical protein [Desulfobacterales bacterium]
MRIPLGVIGIIYESRPNVTVDAAGLCLKAGNAVILRGGSEALHSNRALAAVIAQGARRTAGCREAAVQVVPVTDRAAVNALLAAGGVHRPDHPARRRGAHPLRGRALADPRAQALQGGLPRLRGRGRRPRHGRGDVLQRQGPAAGRVQRHGDPAGAPGGGRAVPAGDGRGALPRPGSSCAAAPRRGGCVPAAVPATDADWPAEYLDLILAVTRGGRPGARPSRHIAAYGSNHTEAIVTRDYERARRFVREVDSSVVLVNASTRFNDGGQLGLGAEIGISTSKLHAFGPMGVEELTTTKFVVYGSGQVRE